MRRCNTQSDVIVAREASLQGASTKPYLLLALSGTEAAVSCAEVKEILPLPNLHAPPTVTGPLGGFLNLSGRPVPVLDLAALLGSGASASSNPYRHVVLAAAGDIGFLVDRVINLIEVDAASTLPIDDGHTLNGCVEAQLAYGDGLVSVLAFDRLITVAERDRLTVLTQFATERLQAFDAA